MYCTLAPAGTSGDVGETVNAIVARAVKDPDMVKQLVPQGMDGLAWGPKAFGDFLKADQERWTATAKLGELIVEVDGKGASRIPALRPAQFGINYLRVEFRATTDEGSVTLSELIARSR